MSKVGKRTALVTIGDTTILVGRILVTIAAINLFALAVFIGLAAIQYSAILSDLTRDRLVVLVDTASRPFSSVAALGIPIGTVRNADAILARIASTDPAIVTIQVLSADGEVVRATNSGQAAAIPKEVFAASLNAGVGETWHLETAGAYMVGTNIEGAGGVHAGSILINYSKDGANLRLQAMEAQLVILAGLIMCATLLIGYGVIRVLLKEHLRIFYGLLDRFDGFERRFWREEPLPAEIAGTVEGLGLNTDEFFELLETSEQRYRDARQKVGGAQ